MRMVLFLVIALIGFAGCKKDSQATPLLMNVIGKWELHRSYGGYGVAMGSFGDSTYKAGNGNLVIFNSDSAYQSVNVSASTTVTNSGFFHILKGSFTGQDDYDELIVSYAGSEGSYVSAVNVSGNILTIEPLTYGIKAPTLQYWKITN